MHHLLHLSLIGCLVLSYATGCSQSPPAESAGSTGIAIIDLDEVAKQLGSREQIADSIEQRESALRTKLVEMAQAYTEQLKKHKASVAPENREQAVQFAQYQQKANQSLNAAKAQAQQDLTKHRSRLVQQFREAVRPAAQQVAHRRGLKVVVARQPGLVLDCAEECDITAEVIEVMQSKSAAPAE